MASVTGNSSKEFLKIGGKPIIDWVLEEALAVASRCVIVASPEKPRLLDYQSERVEIAFQLEPVGMGSAVCLEEIYDDVLVLNPDTIYFPSSPLIDFPAMLEQGSFCLAAEVVLSEDVPKYGIIETEGERVTRLWEKPQPEQTTSRLAVAGRFGMSREVYSFVKTWVRSNPPAGAEQHLTPILSLALSAEFIGTIRTLKAGELRLDCGTPEGYKHACEVVSAAL